MKNIEPQPIEELSFDNLKVAFANKSDRDLEFSYWMFKMMSSPGLVKVMSFLTIYGIKLHLPIHGLIKATLYKQFCGGESLEESLPTVRELESAGIKSILDYSVEGKRQEKTFDATKKQLLKTLKLAQKDPAIPVTCFKMTGIGRINILEKLSAGEELPPIYQKRYIKLQRRFYKICRKAFERQIPIYIDAEESWIQPAIDQLAEEMMLRFNKEQAYIFTTIQMYRHDRLEYFQNLIRDAREKGYIIGVKIVRGAYLEKENSRARQMNYPTPMQPNKEATDKAYNEALKLAIENIDVVEVCAGTHNEESSMYLALLMEQHGLPHDYAGIYFSQLHGMSEHISYNLAYSGYNVSKYLPYGPVDSAVPYLIRRAEENTSISGQMGRQLQLIIDEKRRRKAANQRRSQD